MKTHRIIAPRAGQVDYESVETAALTTGSLHLKTLFTAVSPGTELAWIHAAANTPGEFPWAPGYSGTGLVVAVGEEVTTIQPGDCVVGRLAHAAEQVVAGEDCIAIPPNADFRALSLYRLATIAMHGVRQGGVRLGDVVVVCGLGPIGLLAAQIARISGARRVIGIDPVASRRDLARRCGIEAVEPGGLPESQRARVIIDATGVPAVLAQALSLATIGGVVVLLGSTRGMVEQLDVYSLIHRANASVVGAHEYFRPDYSPTTSREDDDLVVDLILQGRLESGLLISSINAPGDCAQVYAAAKAKPAETMVPLFDWSMA